MKRQDILSSVTPPKGNLFSHWFGGAILKLLGWEVVGKLPEEKKLLIIAAPHTSNWDYIIAMAAKMYVGVNVKYMMKAEAMIWPFSLVFKALGAIPIYRKEKTDIIEQMCDWYDANDVAWMGVAPEGTRSKVTQWKTGFMRIANKADVPIFMIGFHGPKKQIILDRVVAPQGDLTTQVKELQEYAASAYIGINPNKQ